MAAKKKRPPKDDDVTIFRGHMRDALAMAKEGEGELAVLYQDVANDVKARVAARGDSVTQVQLEKDIDEAFEKVALRRIKIIRARIEKAGQIGPKAANETLKKAFGEELGKAKIPTSRKAAQQAAARIAGRMSVDKTSVQKRLRKVDKEVASEMAAEVQKGIRQKKGILGAAREIEKLDPRDVKLPKYIERIKDVAKAGDAEKVKKLTRGYTKYVEGLGEVQPDLSKKPSSYSMRSATKRFMKDIDKASGEGVDAIVDRYVKERAAYRANTIARHETVEAMRRSYIEQAKDKPGVYGMRWVLSPLRHKVPDECDVYANQNAYDLGPGVYPVDKVPTNPHVNCICSVIAAIDRDHFNREVANDNALPGDLKDAKSPGALGWLKQNEAAAAKILGPTRHRMLKEGVNVLDTEGKPRRVKDLLGRTAEAQKVAVGQSHLPPESAKPKKPKSPAAPKKPKLPPMKPAASSAPVPPPGPAAPAAPPPPPPPPSTPPPPRPPPSTPPPPKPPKPPKVLPPMVPAATSEPLPVPGVKQLPAPGSADDWSAKPLEIAEEQREMQRMAREFARDIIASKGLTVGRGTGPLVVDHVVNADELADASDAWNSWFQKSTFHHQMLGAWIAEAPKSFEAAFRLAERTGFVGDPGDFVRLAETKYAATQEALAQRLATTGIQGIGQDGYITLYRGVKFQQAEDVAHAVVETEGAPVRLAVNPLSSWTSSYVKAAEDFAGKEGVVIEKRVHVSRVFEQWEQSRAAHDSSEYEWILTFPEESVIADRVHDPGGMIERYRLWYEETKK